MRTISDRGRRVSAVPILLGLVACAAPATLAAPAAAATPTLPVYEVSAVGLTERQAAALGKAFDIRAARAEDGSVRYAAEDAFLAVPTRDAAGQTKDEDGNPTVTTVLDVDALKRLRTLRGPKALDLVARALSASELTPTGGRAEAGNTTLQTVDRKGRKGLSAALDTTVSYSFTLGDLPYEGPGAKVRVALDGNGVVTGLAYSTRTLKEAGSVPVLDAKAARNRCAKVMGDSVRIRAATPVYYAPDLSTPLKRLEPSLRCSGVNTDGSAAQTLVLPAAVDTVLPEMPPPPPPREPRREQLWRGLPQAANLIEVGSEGTGPCSGLPHTGTNLASFNNRFTADGTPVEFTWRDQNAWEDDFKDPSLGGHDSAWTDHVDMTYWQGHGSPTGFSFAGCSSTDDTFLANTDARWGNTDVEWMSLFTCLVLAENSGGQRWWQRWGAAFDGLHQINSFHTVSYHSASHGGTYANYLVRTPFLWWNKPMMVRSAWAQASIDDQPSSVVWASMGPIGPAGAVNINDYFWGKGPVGADIPASALTGWWYISGPS